VHDYLRAPLEAIDPPARSRPATFRRCQRRLSGDQATGDDQAKQRRQRTRAPRSSRENFRAPALSIQKTWQENGMAGIQFGAAGGGKKAVDAEIPLVPFIDLLLCCVMFLLVTAVWNQMASIGASQNAPGRASSDRVASERIQLQVALSADGFVVSTSAGDSLRVGKVHGVQDLEGLRAQLDKLRTAYPQQHSIAVAAEDGIAFEEVVTTMDAVKSRGFSAITL
jgi:biopolymer transport protein ExbD